MGVPSVLLLPTQQLNWMVARVHRAVAGGM